MGGGGVLPTNKQNKKTASKMCDVHACIVTSPSEGNAWTGCRGVVDGTVSTVLTAPLFDPFLPLIKLCQPYHSNVANYTLMDHVQLHPDKPCATTP